MTIRLTATLDIGGREIRLGQLGPGRSGSLTDWGPPGTEILIFACHDRDAELQVSHEGAHSEQGEGRVVLSTNLETVRRILAGERYARPLVLANRKQATLRLALEGEPDDAV